MRERSVPAQSADNVDVCRFVGANKRSKPKEWGRSEVKRSRAGSPHGEPRTEPPSEAAERGPAPLGPSARPRRAPCRGCRFLLPDLPGEVVGEHGVRLFQRGDLGAEQRDIGRGRGGRVRRRLRGEGEPCLLLRFPVRPSGVEGRETPLRRGAVILHRAEGGDELRGASPPPRVPGGVRRGGYEVAFFHEHAQVVGKRHQNDPARHVVEHRRPRPPPQPDPGSPALPHSRQVDVPLPVDLRAREEEQVELSPLREIEQLPGAVGDGGFLRSEDEEFPVAGVAAPPVYHPPEGDGGGGGTALQTAFPQASSRYSSSVFPRTNRERYSENPSAVFDAARYSSMWARSIPYEWTHPAGWAPRGAATTRSMWRADRKISPGRARRFSAGTTSSTVTIACLAASTASRSASRAEQTTFPFPSARIAWMTAQSGRIAGTTKISFPEYGSVTFRKSPRTFS